MTIYLRTRLPIFIVLLALGVTNIGCDLGTYAQRAAESSKDFQPPEMAKPSPTAEEQ